MGLIKNQGTWVQVIKLFTCVIVYMLLRPFFQHEWKVNINTAQFFLCWVVLGYVGSSQKQLFFLMYPANAVMPKSSQQQQQ